MTLDEYEKSEHLLYREFAQQVRFIIEKAIAAKNLPVPQSIQCREKSPASVRKRLEENGKIDSPHIELERKDLAGARLIFYTDNDAESFLKGGIIYDNFKVDPSSIKFHYPTVENQNRRYQAQHFIVGLNDERAKLIEYSKYSGLRCEVQIHTILNHAWSETSHEIYKDEPREGFANKAMEAISRRLDKVMDKYLLPAGREFARIQHDYDRVKEGRTLFDADVWQQLKNASSNNERCDILSALKNEMLPNYDDLRPIFPEFIQPLVDAALAARGTPAQPITTTFGSYEGKSASDVTRIVVQVLESYRYIDVEATFRALCDLFRNETDSAIKKALVGAASSLAKYEAHVWRSAGPYVQSKLALLIDDTGPKARDGINPILIEVWGALLSSEISGTDWTATGVTISSGSIVVSDEVKSIRSKAMASLFVMFSQSQHDAERRNILHALRNSTSVPNIAEFSNELLSLTIEDNTRLAEHLTSECSQISYELLQTTEHEFLFDYRRAREIAEEEGDKFNSKGRAIALIKAIEAFRDKINGDPEFVRYKILVGFESVYPFHWDEPEYDYYAEQKYRNEEIDRFVSSIDPSSQAGWTTTIERCAKTRSDDGATFPAFVRFLQEIARANPIYANNIMLKGNPDVMRFASAILDGMYLSDDKPLYQRAIERELHGKHLHALAQHWRRSTPNRTVFATTMLNKAIESADELAVLELTAFAMQSSAAVPARDVFLVPGIQWLTTREDARWVNIVGYSPEASEFLTTISEDDAKLLLNSLISLPKITSPAERVIALISRSQMRAVWDYIGQRLERGKRNEGAPQYEDVPYRLHDLSKTLSQDIAIAIDSARAWYAKDASLFQYRGGRFLRAVFLDWEPAFASQLQQLVCVGSSDDANFVLAVMANYKKKLEAHPLFKAIIAKYPQDSAKHAVIRNSLMSTGVMWGQYGIVESFRITKETILPWCEDANADVKAFAENLVRILELQIAQEQKRADNDRLSRDGEEGDDDDNAPPK